jgi:DNA-binding HxlR family transcriptional regulator
MGRPGCPVEKAVNTIGGKWNTLIVRDLLEGKQRFNELQESLTGISSKVLTEKLQYLENQQVIRREVLATSPPSVYYELTEYGQKLDQVINALQIWGSIEPPKVKIIK